MASIPQQGAQRTRQPALPVKRANDLPVYLAAILGYLLLLPPQLNLSIAGSILPPYRAFLLLASLYMLAGLFRKQMRYSWADLAILGATVWICIAMSVSSEMQQAITGSAAHVIDIGFGYFFARMAFRDLRDLRMFLLLLLPGLLVIGLILALESITHTHILQSFFSQLTGNPVVYRSDPRMGLMRAQGPFAHPISAGIFMSSFLALYWLAGFKGWVRILGTFAALLSFFSVSSATILSLVAAFGLLAYNWLTEHITNLTWKLFFIFAGLFVFFAELGTKSGTFSLFVRFASLNSNSAYHRVLIWEYGSQNVAKNPWFGIGYAEWERPAWMPGSMDNYWLLTAVRFGLPTSALIGLATLIAVVLMIRKSTHSTGADQTCERSVAIALSVFAFGLISVSVWLTPQVWYFVLLGLTVSLALAEPKPLPGRPAPRPGPRAGRGPVPIPAGAMSAATRQQARRG